MSRPAYRNLLEAESVGCRSSLHDHAASSLHRASGSELARRELTCAATSNVLDELVPLAPSRSRPSSSQPPRGHDATPRTRARRGRRGSREDHPAPSAAARSLASRRLLGRGGGSRVPFVGEPVTAATRFAPFLVGELDTPARSRAPPRSVANRLTARRSPRFSANASAPRSSWMAVPARPPDAHDGYCWCRSTSAVGPAGTATPFSVWASAQPPTT
jgi:hypothetical protein